jgi:hypothetical protein
MKLYLDDEREAPEGWIRVHTVPDLIHMVRNSANEVQVISLDHDLGEGELSGYDFLKWLEEEVAHARIKSISEIHIHSANPAGVKNMQSALQSIHRILLRIKNTQNNLEKLKGDSK